MRLITFLHGEVKARNFKMESLVRSRVSGSDSAMSAAASAKRRAA